MNVTWRKSSYSGPNGNCVEVANTLGAVRDSKQHTGPTLTTPELPEFVRLLKAGDFDR